MPLLAPLTDSLGKTLFDRRFTLYEDPHIGPRSRSFDDEGTPTQAKTFIDRGTVATFYWDRRWASRTATEPTGNGFRSGLGQPTPGLTDLCIAPGDRTFAELVASIEEGAIVDSVLGAGQSNQFAGEFSVNLDLGYKVEKGAIVGRLKNTMVAGNIFDAFRQLADLGNAPEWVGSTGTRVPSLLFAGLGVAARH